MAKTSIRFHACGIAHRTEVTREQFEVLTEHLLAKTEFTTVSFLRSAGFKWRDITRILLVGGASNMSSVRKMLQKVSGQIPDTGINPTIANALGAAVYAQAIGTGNPIQIVASS